MLKSKAHSITTVNHRTPDIVIVEARKSLHVDVRGEFLSPFLIDTCEISLQTNFSDVADTAMYIPYYNKWSAKIYSSCKNNRNVPQITDDFLLFATKIRVLKAV